MTPARNVSQAPAEDVSHPTVSDVIHATVDVSQAGVDVVTHSVSHRQMDTKNDSVIQAVEAAEKSVVIHIRLPVAELAAVRLAAAVGGLSTSEAGRAALAAWVAGRPVVVPDIDWNSSPAAVAVPAVPAPAKPAALPPPFE